MRPIKDINITSYTQFPLDLRHLVTIKKPQLLREFLTFIIKYNKDFNHLFLQFHINMDI